MSGHSLRRLLALTRTLSPPPLLSPPHLRRVLSRLVHQPHELALPPRRPQPRVYLPSPRLIHSQPLHSTLCPSHTPPHFSSARRLFLTMAQSHAQLRRALCVAPPLRRSLLPIFTITFQPQTA